MNSTIPPHFRPAVTPPRVRSTPPRGGTRLAASRRVAGFNPPDEGRPHIVRSQVARAGGTVYLADWWTPTALSTLPREELESLLDELLVELEDSGVAGVRVDHQLIVRQTSGHVQGVRRRQHPVVIAVHEEHGLADE